MVTVSHSKFDPLCDKGKVGSKVDRLPTGGPGDRVSILGKGGGYVSINSLVSKDTSSKKTVIWP